MAAYGFSCAPVPVISSPYVHVAAPAFRDGDLLLQGALRDHLAVDDLEVGGVDLQLLAAISSSFCAFDRLANGVAGDEGRARREGPVQSGDESVFELSYVIQS